MGNIALITEGLALDNGGQLTYRKFTLTWDYIANLGGAALTVDIPLHTLPRGGFLLFCMIHATTQFAGVTTLTASVGNAGSATQFTAASADLVGTAIADTAIRIGPTSATPGGTMARQAINARLTSTGTNLNTLTAGQVDIFIAFGNVTTPAANIG